MTRGTLDQMKAASADAAGLMRALSHESRLLVLCALCEGEQQVSDLVEVTALSPSALSQHLAKLRADDLVSTRREGQAIFYSLANPAVRKVISVLQENFCPA